MDPAEFQSSPDAVGMSRRRLLGAAACGLVLPAALPRLAGAEVPARLLAGGASLTAQGAAVQRALHQIIDLPRVFDDPLAVAMLGADAAPSLQAAADRPSPGLRAYIAMRSRHAEDRLAEAVRRGVHQYVLLGAGLDSFACRNPHPGLRVFEVDHPATQQWKRRRLADAGIAAPVSMNFVPVDFESQRLDRQLTLHGFRFDKPAFFSMLGVVIYISEEALEQTLRVVAACAPGSGLTFSFTLPAHRLGDAARAARERSMAAVAKLGEPWITFLEPEALPSRLHAAGFSAVELLDGEAGNRLYFAGRSDGLRLAGSAQMATAWI